MTTTHGRRFLRTLPALLLVLILVGPLRLAGQSAQPAPQAPAATWADALLKQESYAQPPREIADAVLAPRHLNITLANLSPDRNWFLDEIGDGPVVMKTFAKPFHELGGVFIDDKANRARTLTVRNNIGIQVISAADGTKKPIQIPPGVRVSNAAWSPDSASIAYLAHSDDATHIWMADVASGKSRQVTRTPLLATLVTSFEYTADGKQIAAVVVPEGRAPMPPAPPAPDGPTVRIADSDKNRLRTFASLMSTTYEKQLLEWHATGQVALIDVQKGVVRKVGPPVMVRSVDVSPDGKYLRVTQMLKPFSYDVPVSSFGQVEEVWDADGKILAKLTERPTNLGVQDDTQPPADPPFAGGGRGGANQAGKRDIAWRADGQGLIYLEQEPAPAGAGTGGRGRRGGGASGAEPEGRGGRGADRKDRLYQWSPPFDEPSRKVLFESTTRMTGLRFSPDMKMIFFSERAGQTTVEYAVALAEPTERYTLARYPFDDVDANPGTLVGTRSIGGGGGRGAGGGGRGGGAAAGAGPVQLSADGSSVYFSGAVYDKNPSEVGPKSFIDKVAITTGEKQRIYESDNNGVYERVSAALDIEAGRFVVAREGPKEVPQHYLMQNGVRTPLTKNQDYTPDVTNAVVERITIERPDGFTFRTTVTLPQGYQKGTRLPAIFWFYPREFQDQEAYDRRDRTFNKNAFQAFGFRSMEFLVRLGYAVVEPDAPIVGPAGQMNNNYVHDLRNNLAAVIDELDRRELVDRTRLAIGGHSYGAFSAVNAMVHTPFFKAGIAGDGAYNRTLTPLGFQSERRDLWEAPNVYMSMSPFLYANNLTGALLMYHAIADQNVGTDPQSSIRLYHALNGLGKTTALYLYPLEDHGPVAKETLLDLWARWSAWLDKYVKNPNKTDTKKTTTTDEHSR
jgi:dipeptidyl aminopeptidase/acylaminoacyl peptidase